MGAKITFEPKAPAVPPRTYPYVGKWETVQSYVLFVAPRKGIYLQGDGTWRDKPGEFQENWNEHDFEPVPGNVTIEIGGVA